MSGRISIPRLSDPAWPSFKEEKKELTIDEKMKKLDKRMDKINKKMKERRDLMEPAMLWLIAKYYNQYMNKDNPG